MGDKMKIELTKDEIETAAIVGVKRHIASSAIGRKDATGNKNNFQSHIIGAIGEYAVCKIFERHWDITTGGGINKNDIPSSKKPIDIKTSTKPHAKNCLVNQSTTPEKYAGFIFIFGAFSGFNFQFWGWIESEKYFQHAKLEVVKNGRKPCWLMNRDKLNQITPSIVEQYKNKK